MSVSINDMRFIISQVYKGDKWKYRVEHMTDRQVMAIYFSFCERGEFDKKPKVTACCGKRIEIDTVDDYAGEQMWMNAIFD